MGAKRVVVLTAQQHAALVARVDRGAPAGGEDERAAVAALHNPMILITERDSPEAEAKGERCAPCSGTGIARGSYSGACLRCYGRGRVL
jgi:hypothetical protein